MPTVLVHAKGWRVVIYPNDHRPPHVHVLGPDVHARFELLCDLGQVKPLSNVGFTHSQLQTLANFLARHVKSLCKAWGEIHGH